MTAISIAGWVFGILALILVVRQLKTRKIFHNRTSPRTEAMVVVQWAERIMRKIDNLSPQQ
jgi:hypothetical protein